MHREKREPHGSLFFVLAYSEIGACKRYSLATLIYTIPPNLPLRREACCKPWFAIYDVVVYYQLHRRKLLMHREKREPHGSLFFCLPVGKPPPLRV